MGCQRRAKATYSERGSDFDKLNPPPAGWPLARRVGFNRIPRTEAGFQSADSKMKNGLGRDVNAGLKPLAQNMEALRADGRVGFCGASFRATDFHELRQDFNPPIQR